VTAFDDPVTAAAWSPDGAQLAVAVAPGGGLNVQLYLMRPDGSGLRRITAGGRETNSLNLWTRDGPRGALHVEPREPRRDARVPVRGGERRHHAGGRHRRHRQRERRERRRRARHRLPAQSRGDNDVWLRDVRSGREVRLTPHGDRSQFDGGIFSDARTVWLASNRDTDLSALARVRLGPDGAPGPLELVARATTRSWTSSRWPTTAASGRSSGTWRGGARSNCSTRRAGAARRSRTCRPSW
jgi:hypothetical protein